jgi:hypothetical protein
MASSEAGIRHSANLPDFDKANMLHAAAQC